MRHGSITIALSFLVIACNGYWEPVAREPAPRVDAAPALALLDLRIRTPREPEPDPEHPELGPSAEVRVRRSYAEHGARELARIDLFRSVALEVEPVSKGESTVRVEVLKPRPAARATCEPDEVLIVVFSLGLYPMECAEDHGVHLRFPGGASANVVCPWPRTWRGGLWPLVLPGYTRKPNAEAYAAHLRACILTYAERFVAAAGR